MLYGRRGQVMSEKNTVINTPGVVLRTTDVGDRDKMLTVLTPDYGKLSVFARGVRKITSGSLPAAQLFAYARMTLRSGSQYYYLKEAAIEETFLGISKTIEGAALASYLCEAADELTVPDLESKAMMQLVLNTLWTIAGQKRPNDLIKGAFELRAAAISGYMPDLTSCCVCGCEECGEHGMLDIMNGRLFCTRCYAEMYAKTSSRNEAREPLLFRRVNQSALQAMRYVLYTEAKRQFSFTVEGEGILLFTDACETYLLHHVGHGYRTLSYYKSIKEQDTITCHI